MVMGFSLGLMEEYMKVIMNTIKNKDKEHFNGQMVGNILVVGLMEDNMVKEFIFL